MILTVDIGNTNIKLGAWDKEELVFVSRLQTNTLRTEDEYKIALLDIFRLNEYNSAQFDGAIIASVVPQLSDRLRRAVRSVIHSRRVFLVSPGIKTGLNIKIDDPATLGSDIVCAGVAVLGKYPLPCIMVSLGTAITLFALDRDGACLGGAVVPGIHISLEALSLRTAQLPHISLTEPQNVIGANTVESMKSGAVYGYAAMLDGMVARMKAEVGEDATLIATGGGARHIVRHCQTDFIMDDNIVLEGLKLIYYKNIKP